MPARVLRFALHARPKPKTNQFRPLARVADYCAGPPEQLPLLLQGFRSRSPVKQGRVQGINRVPVLMVGSFRHRNVEMNNTSRNPCAAVEQGNIRSAIARIAPENPVGPENFGRFPDYSEDNLSVRRIKCH